MLQLFKNWVDLYRVCNDESTVWGQKIACGEEVLVYENPTNEDLILSDEPIDYPDWVLVEF